MSFLTLPVTGWAQSAVADASSAPPPAAASASPAPPASASPAPSAAPGRRDAAEPETPHDSLEHAPESDTEPSSHRAREVVVAAPLAPGYGRIRVAVNRPETEVFVDGRLVGTAPVDHDLLRGPHLLRLACAGFKDWQGSVDIDEGTLVPVRVTLRPQLDRTAGGVTLTLAALVLGAGFGTGIASNMDHAALEQDRLAGRLDNHDSRIDRGAILAGAADGIFVLSAVLFAGGIYLLAHDPTSPSLGHVGRAHPIATGITP